MRAHHIIHRRRALAALSEAPEGLLRSPGGLSHHPGESRNPTDIGAAEYFRAIGTPLGDPLFLDCVAIRFGADPAAGLLSRAAAAYAVELQHLPGILMRAHHIMHRRRALAALSETTEGLLRSPGGLSHHPGESRNPTDIGAALLTHLEPSHA